MVELGLVMTTTIEIDGLLVTEAMAASGLPSERATVEAALRDMIAHNRQRSAIDSLAGIGWEGDLHAMREGWSPPAIP